jgi:photosystem II stability/assembly factor-like uncharacterized protein
VTRDREHEDAAMRDILRAAIEPPSPGLADRALAGVGDWPDASREPRSSWAFGLVAVLLAAALVATLAAGLRLARPSARAGAGGPAVSQSPPGAAAVPIPGSGVRLFLDSAARGWLAREAAGAGEVGRTTLYETSDGGRTWTARLAYDGGPPSQVVVDASGAGVVVAGQRDAAAADLVLFQTRDGGLTWQRAPVPDGVSAWGVPYFVDAARGWVLGSLGLDQAEVLSTSDGGRTWSASTAFNDRANFPGLSSVRLRILWADGGRAIVVPPLDAGTAPVHVFVTEDGGATWRSSFPAAVPGTALSIANAMLDARLMPDGTGALFLQPVDSLGRSASLIAYTTSDAGQRWSQPVRLDGPAPAGSPRALFALDEGHWWASSGSGADLLATDDGGRTVRRHSRVLPAGYVFQSIGFASPAEGWAIAVAGARTAAFVTHDGGARWQPLTPPPS